MSGGNCRHQVIVEVSDIDPEKKVVVVYNDNDEHYAECLRTREDVDILIGKLTSAADKAFGVRSR